MPDDPEIARLRADRAAAVRVIRDAAAADQWPIAQLMLHPYLRWTTPDGTTIRGRRHVVEHLAGRRDLAEPESVELRDDQVYRWVEPPASTA